MARNYELVLMLDPEAPEADRDKVLADVRSQIETRGTLEKADDWGTRKMTYEIKGRTESDYRYFRFVGENDLLEWLDHNLKIIDTVLRFRVFKVDPDAPTDAPPLASQLAPTGGDRDDRDE
jgi:small subunit ribosomal protein S6